MAAYKEKTTRAAKAPEPKPEPAGPNCPRCCLGPPFKLEGPGIFICRCGYRFKDPA